MATMREINIKPSCMSEIHGFPSAQAASLWEKINYLVQDPLPDGKLKKKIKAAKDLYRIRVGDYRIFYTFGSTWVRLLGIRRRDSHTYKDNLGNLAVDGPAQNRDESSDDDLDLLLEKGVNRPQFRFQETETVSSLPREITPEWLAVLRVPAAYIPTLVCCKSEEALLMADIPANILERIVDNLFPKPIEEVAKQPDLVIQDPADLVRYKEGGLISFLLKLDEDQYKLTEWAIKGPTMVKGGAGTGKSTVALYRVKALLEKTGFQGNETVLFTTYTRALLSTSEQLLKQLLTAEQFARVRVATCDQITLEIVKKNRQLGKLESGGIVLQTLRAIRSKFAPTAPSIFDQRLRQRSLESLSDRYLLEEFDWIIDGRGIGSLEAYLEAPRPGRGYAFRSGLREAVWELYETFLVAIEEAGVERFADIRSEALSLVQQGKWIHQYDYMIVDEAQDLTPTVLCLMAELVKTKEGLFFAADNKQSIYSRNYTWQVVHPKLRFKGRTSILRRNYRSTAEIDRAAYDVLEPEDNEEIQTSKSIHNGPLPVCLTGVDPDVEVEWCAKFIRQMSRHLSMKTNAAAILVPNKIIGGQIAGELQSYGVPAKYFAGRDLDLNSEVVKVLTLHSAKGLEFPMVIVCGLVPGTYPVASEFGDPDVYLERMRHERRLLYVGMTRAMRGLMIIMPEGCQHEALMGLNTENWHMEKPF